MGKILVGILFLFLSVLSSCEQPEEIRQIEEYEGPLREAEDIELYYTELSQIKTKVIAAKVWEYKEGDREFPEGIFLEFYDEQGNTTSTLRANKAYFTKSKNLWRGEGNVVVRNLDEGQQLTTEELYWDPNKKIIHTEKFVTVREGEQVLYGTGLEAQQDFSTWFIKDVEGEFYIEEGSEN